MADADGRRVVAVMPHPDDEAYSVSATLAAHVHSGGEAHLITATNGESGWLSKSVADEAGGRSVAEVREAELMRACAAIGIPDAIRLGWPDGGIAGMNRSAGVAELSAQLTDLRADVVLTLARDGVYGHRDHIALTEMVLESFDGPVLLATFPRGLLAPLARWFRKHKSELVAESTMPSLLGDSAIDFVHVLTPELAAIKRNTIACHRSQLLSEYPLEFLLPGLIDEVCAAEWFVMANEATLPRSVSALFDTP